MSTHAQQSFHALRDKNGDFGFRIAKSSIIACVLAIGVFSNYIYGVLGVGYIDDLLNIVILVWAVFAVMLSPYVLKKYNIVWFSFFVFILLSIAFLFESPVAFVYEIYKLFIFLIFLPLLISLSRVTVRRSDEKILVILATLLAINLLVVTLQYLISPNIVTYLGLPIDQVTVSQKEGRWIGFFESVNSMGDTALLLYFLNEFVRPSFHKIARFIFFTSVVISTSKHAVLLLALMIFLLSFRSVPFRSRKHFVSRISRILLVIVSVVFVTVLAYGLNKNSFDQKLDQYHYFLQNINNITEQDARFIERRALNIGIGLSILRDNPYGVGLGVWGDASSKYNEKDYPFYRVIMSDSSMIHLLVEQGGFVIFYFMVLISGFIAAIKYGNAWYMFVLLAILFSINVVTMGLSSSGWPLLFAYIYARLLWGAPENYNVFPNRGLRQTAGLGGGQ